ncbi:hypothetical protein BN903_143 [Halorubrum sp. AJ67]|nr:hypothetical protein BN903_143 [Halorubrum sp. AJ67]
MVDAEYQYFSELLVSIDCVFCKHHLCSIQSFELFIQYSW